MKNLKICHLPPLSYAGQEAINTLCTNLTFSGEKVRKIVITSSHASEGKSFVAMNIMRTMAHYGKKVALVDADLRRSYIAAKYDVHFAQPDQNKGLAHFLAGMVDENDVIYQTNIDGAYMVPMGTSVSAPMPLLNSERFPLLLCHLSEACDYVLIDAPPVGTVIDAAEIAKSCDGILVVVDYDEVHRQELIEVQRQLEQTGCPVLGAILNRVDPESFFSKKYYYKSYYSNYGDAADDAHHKKQKGKRKRK